MKHKFGVAASHIDVVFKKNGREVFSAKGTLGCLRKGEPEDSYNVISQGLARMDRAIREGKANADVRAFDSVSVGKKGREFTRTQLVRARVIDEPFRVICGKPRSRKKDPKPNR